MVVARGLRVSIGAGIPPSLTGSAMTNNDEATLIDGPQKPATPGCFDFRKKQMQRLLLWLEEQGATFPSVKIEISDDGREARAGAPIKAGALIMHIPQSLMITSQRAKESEIGRLIASNTCHITDNGYMAAYLLDFKRDGGFWQPYLDALPQDFPDHIYFYDESELDYLKGCYMLPRIRRRRARLDFEYYQMRSCLPEEKAFTREEYAWARCAVLSRVHAVTTSGKSGSALIPLADMLNHSADANVNWQPESPMGFIYTAARNIEAGEPLTISYGNECNGIWFSTYGFCLESNPNNLAEIQLPSLPPDHPCFEHAKQLGTERKEMRVFEVPADYGHRDTRALFSYLRVYGLTDSSEVKLDKGGHVAPVSPENEQAVLSELALACQLRLRQFDTSIEEDDALLKYKVLPLRLRNAVRVRHGEKVVLKYFRDLALAAMPMSPATIPAKKFEKYFDHIAPLLRGSE